MTIKETWAYALGKFFIDPIWWFFLFWLPGYLFDRYDLDLKSFGLPLAAIYLISDIGSIAGGWMSSQLIAGRPQPPISRASSRCSSAPSACCRSSSRKASSSVWGAVLVIGLATAAHQAFSANLYTLPSDIFPRVAVGSVIGIGGTVGAVGGMGMSLFTGYILDATDNNYSILFAMAGGAYFVALIAVHLLSPRLARVEA